MPSATPAPLTGFLYGLSLISSIVVACIGLSMVIGGPTAGNLIFGIPITNSALAVIDKSKAVGKPLFLRSTYYFIPSLSAKSLARSVSG